MDHLCGVRILAVDYLVLSWFTHLIDVHTDRNATAIPYVCIRSRMVKTATRKIKKNTDQSSLLTNSISKRSFMFFGGISDLTNGKLGPSPECPYTSYCYQHKCHHELLQTLNWNMYITHHWQRRLSNERTTYSSVYHAIQTINSIGSRLYQAAIRFTTSW